MYCVSTAFSLTATFQEVPVVRPLVDCQGTRGNEYTSLHIITHEYLPVLAFRSIYEGNGYISIAHLTFSLEPCWFAAPIHMSTHQYTSVHIISSLHMSTHQYTSVHIITHQYASVHTSTHQYSFEYPSPWQPAVRRRPVWAYTPPEHHSWSGSAWGSRKTKCWVKADDVPDLAASVPLGSACPPHLPHLL